MNALMLAALLAAPGAAPPQEARADAVLAKVTGHVTIASGGSPRYKARGGETLLYGDSVRTAPGAVAHIVLKDRGAVLIHENSFFVLSGNDRRTLLDFARGEFLIGLKKKLEKGMTFKVRTPASVAAVRGTLFWGKSDKDKTTTYAGFGHRIDVTAKGKTVTVEAGQTVTVPFGGPPSAAQPHSIPVEYTQRFHINGGLQGLEKLVALPAPQPEPR
jgi:hypothetical protein